MKILTVDIGNSNIVIGCAENHRITFAERMHSDRNKTDLEYVIGCKTVLELHHIAADSLDGAIISSVVPQLTDLFASAIEKLTGIVPLIVGPGIKTGIKLQPAGVGADLVVGAVAVLHEYGAPAIIIDMGTATAGRFHCTAPRYPPESSRKGHQYQYRGFHAERCGLRQCRRTRRNHRPDGGGTRIPGKCGCLRRAGIPDRSPLQTSDHR